MHNEDELHVIRTALEWMEGGADVALATVIHSWGSSPRPPGSLMAVADDGRIAGSVSGGCVEAAVMEEAMAALATGCLRVVEYGVTQERAWEVGLACGGKVRILVEPVQRNYMPLLHGIREACAPGGKGIGLIRSLKTGGWALSPLDWQAGSSVLLEEQQLTQSFHPPARILMVGAVHVAQTLSGLATKAGFACTVIDPRAALLTAERFPDARLCVGWPDEMIKELKPDIRTAVIVLSHDPKLDDPALLAALHTQAFYIGALGSARTHAARLARLRDQGVSESALGRVRGPAGLQLGGRGVTDIALSILAEISAVRHGAALAIRQDAA
ncbi:CoxI protein [Granulibacter bethesdensis]|uniref:CoxI protein n=1 Tax=Granulibacter bethesdensis TaxID=364410 RepID=A0AAC9K6S5_9PROT|nr:XdhC family protein [Granulibacter bethesdensis]APH54181.1 CoxI protein [Granulibacter bethesdensis]APH61763.1 CoxI protein [Granulibacter bethesdensis]